MEKPFLVITAPPTEIEQKMIEFSVYADVLYLLIISDILYICHIQKYPNNHRYMQVLQTDFSLYVQLCPNMI